MRTEIRGLNNLRKTVRSIYRKTEAEKVSSSLERNKYIYELINRWIENADNKVSVSFGVVSGVFSILVFLIENSGVNWNSIIQSKIGMYLLISLVVSIVFMIRAFIFYTLCLIPNLKSSKSIPSNLKYPVFFGDIQSLSLDDYRNLTLKGNNEDFNDELITEIWYNSKICTKKMQRYRTALISSSISLGSMLICYLLTLIG